MKSLTQTELAKLLKLSAARVSQLTSKGFIPREKSGNYQQVPALLGYIESLRKGANETADLMDEERREKVRKLKIDNDKNYKLLTPWQSVSELMAKDHAVTVNTLIRRLVRELPPRVAKQDVPAIRELMKTEIAALVTDLKDQLREWTEANQPTGEAVEVDG